MCVCVCAYYDAAATGADTLGLVRLLLLSDTLILFAFCCLLILLLWFSLLLSSGINRLRGRRPHSSNY